MDLDLLNDLLNKLDWVTSSQREDLRSDIIVEFIFPRLMINPETFIEKCIKHFEGNIGLIISHINEDEMDFIIEQLKTRKINWTIDNDHYELDDILKI